MVIAQRQSAAGRDQNVAQPRVADLAVPGQIGAQKNKSQVVHVPVVLLRFEQARIMFGVPLPVVLAGLLSQQPHHAREKSAAPIGPALTVMPPTTAAGVHRKKVGVALDHPSHLAGCEFNCTLKSIFERFSINRTRFGHSVNSTCFYLTCSTRALGKSARPPGIGYGSKLC